MASLEEITVMVRHLAKRHTVRRDEVVAVARQNPELAQRAISTVLAELSNGHFVTDVEKLMRLAWQLEGPTECLSRIFPTIPDRPFVHFLTCELRENPDQFTDEQLRDIAAMSRPKEIAAAVEMARIRRAKLEAQRLLSSSPELEEDLGRVQAQVSEHNFSPVLNDLLDKVALGFGQGDGFDQAAMMKHLRTFFEKLHQGVAEKLHSSKPETKDGTDLTKCQQSIDYLQRKDVLSPKTQTLGRALYGVLSEEGVHALQSTREYVRLCRNFVVEYALILFYELDRRLKE